MCQRCCIYNYAWLYWKRYQIYQNGHGLLQNSVNFLVYLFLIHKWNKKKIWNFHLVIFVTKEMLDLILSTIKSYNIMEKHDICVKFIKYQESKVYYTIESCTEIMQHSGFSFILLYTRNSCSSCCNQVKYKLLNNWIILMVYIFLFCVYMELSLLMIELYQL